MGPRCLGHTNHSLPDVANPVPSPKPASVQEDAVAPAAGFRCTFCKGKFKKRHNVESDFTAGLQI